MSSKDRPERGLQPPGDGPAAKPQAPDVRPFERLIRAIAKVALGLSAAALLASLATIVYSVVRRYAFNAPVAWSDELVGYLLVASVMLVSAAFVAALIPAIRAARISPMTALRAN